uniref:Uncharacterized protein n=1 Tax=Knipowitschia caucasica TaxID=637954 RepID=A0AAV2K1Y3_KNICA
MDVPDEGAVGDGLVVYLRGQMLSVGVLPARQGSKLGKTPAQQLVAQSAPGAQEAQGVQDSPAVLHR